MMLSLCRACGGSAKGQVVGGSVGDEHVPWRVADHPGYLRGQGHGLGCDPTGPEDRYFAWFHGHRFAVVRDTTTFQDTFRGRIGPVWNTQHVELHAGKNWLNTYFSKLYSYGAHTYDNPRCDLLVYHVPRPDRKLVVEQREDLKNAGLSSSYVWEGDVSPGLKTQFSQILLPHAPELSAAELAG